MENKIKEMSYTDFVGFINQWNVLPGAYNTLSKWKVFSSLNSKSRILEIACTTGFSSREIALMSECKGIGIDISEKSIQSSIKNKEAYAPNIKINYRHASAYDFSDKKRFTHIILGSSLGFFDEPKEIIEKMPDLLREGGYILASPFYVNKKIPKKLVDRAKAVFDINITQENYKEIMSLYSDFEIAYEERNILIPETKEELEHYCLSTLKKLKGEGTNLTKDEYEESFKRLMEIKEMSNVLRSYQGYSVLVLRYRKSTYKNRCVELF